MIVPVSFTVKSGLSPRIAIRIVDDLNKRFTTVKFYHTPDSKGCTVRGIIKELDVPPNLREVNYA